MLRAKSYELRYARILWTDFRNELLREKEMAIGRAGWNGTAG